MAKNTGLHIACSNAMNRDQLKKAVKDERKNRSILALITQCVDLGLPLPRREADDLIPGRHWKADLVWDDAMLIVEYEGGTFQHGKIDPETGEVLKSRHVTPIGFRNDCEKYNAFGAAGWLVMRVEASKVADKSAAAEIQNTYYARLLEARIRYEMEAAQIFHDAVQRFGGAECLRRIRAAIWNDDATFGGISA